jgi:transglutaminase-like putative cysteine protease
MMRCCLLVALAGILLPLAGVRADEPNPAAIRLGEPKTSQWRIGVTVKATGAVTGILATTPVPRDWPEQTVKIVGEEKSAQVGRISYRTLDDGVKQMLVSIPRLAAGDEAQAIVTFEVAKSRILEPLETTGLTPPAKTNRELAKFLLPSPYIESTDPKIKSLAAEITAGKPAGWETSAAVFDWVRENVKYEFAEQIKPAVQALADRQGDCEELSSLVIALCRASKIPARAVWVPGHCYPEFYLEDGQGKGHWYPCQAAGAERQLGSMIEDRPILQKGDNFKVPEERGPQRYVKQFLTARNAAADPEVKFVLERVKPRSD